MKRTAKLIKILAASVGGGLILGAGIRLGEAIAAQKVVGLAASSGLSELLGELEERLQRLERESPAVIAPPLDKQAALVEMGRQLRGELGDWFEERLTARMADVELQLKAESECGRKQLLEAFAESVQTRVIQRISKLEEEVAGQSAAMSELRECSLRTEQSIQKLLSGLDRVITKNPSEPEEDGNPSSAAGARIAPREVTPAVIPEKSGEAPSAQPEPPAFAPQLKPQRWKIFG